MTDRTPSGQGDPVRLLLIAADRQARLDLRAELIAPEFEVLADAATLHGAVTALRSMPATVVVLDPDLPGISVVEACRRVVAAAHNDVAIVVRTQRVDAGTVQSVLDTGVRAYVVGSAGDGTALGRIVLRAAAGETFVDPRASRGLRGASPGDRLDHSALSAREQDVLALVAEGLTNAEIGHRLYLSRHTVKEYLSAAMRKLGVSSRVEAALIAAQGGLLAGQHEADLRQEPTEAPANVTVEPARSGALTGLEDSDISIPVVKLRAD